MAPGATATPPAPTSPGPASRGPEGGTAVPAGGRLDALDGLRGLAALGIVLLHVWMFDHGDAGRPPKGPADLVIGELRLGVPLFFVLSGFLVFRPWAAAALDGRPAPRPGRYVLRRAARIVPAYWAALAAAFVGLRVVDHPLLEATAKQDLDPPMWTLGVEVSFYAILPLVGWAATRIGRRRGARPACAAGCWPAGRG